MKELKEFGDWYRKRYPRYLPDSSQSNFVFHGAAYAGWKAALEWALSLNSVRVHDNVYEDIKKELNAKT